MFLLPKLRIGARALNKRESYGGDIFSEIIVHSCCLFAQILHTSIESSVLDSYMLKITQHWPA